MQGNSPPPWSYSDPEFAFWNGGYHTDRDLTFLRISPRSGPVSKKYAYLSGQLDSVLGHKKSIYSDVVIFMR